MIAYTPDGLLEQARAAAEAHERLLAQHPPGTFNQERNDARDLRDKLLACAKHMQDQGIASAMHVGPFSAEQFRKGQRVRIRAGARVRSTNPKARQVQATRARVVTVFSIDRGYVCDDGVRNPEVCWVGTGGFWCYADLNDVQAQSAS